MLRRKLFALVPALVLAGFLLAGALAAGDPPGDGKAAGGDPPPPAEEAKPAVNPAPPRDLIASHVADIEGVAVPASAGGLKVKAFIVPDALAFRIALEYLKRRGGGDDHAAAVRGTAPFLAPWKRCQGMAAVRIRIEDASPIRAGPGAPPTGPPRRRVFTLQKNFEKDALAIFAGKTRLPVRLAGPPRNLRQAGLRIKKFWKMSEGPGRNKRGDPGDASTYGREAILSKPFQALLVEEAAVVAEALFKAKGEKTLPTLVVLSGFKRYEGPFADDILDLNANRGTWEEVEAISIDLRPPPGGLEIPRAVVDLVDEVRAAAAAKN